MRWLDVDVTHARIMLPQTKGGNGRIVYLNQSALAALRAVRSRKGTRATGLVCGGITPEQVSLGFARVCRKQRVLDFRFHDLRHTAAGGLRMQGDIHTVAQLPAWIIHEDLLQDSRPAAPSVAPPGLTVIFACYPPVRSRRRRSLLVG